MTDIITTDYKSIKPYVDKLVKYASSKQPVFLVIDNIDQFEKDEFQGQIFSDAISFASRFNINLVLAMREGTFVRHRNHPSFDAFDFDPLSIDPPEIRSVLSKRFLVLRKELEGKSGQFIAENGARFDVDDLSLFADIVQRSVLGTHVGTRIEVLANGDVRLALRMTREFLERGYTEPGKAINTFRSKGEYLLPRHEAFRAILLGNQNVYSEAFSVIGNPFDARLSRSSSQLLRLFILSGLVRFGSEAVLEYVDGSMIRDVSRKLGYGDASVLRVVEDLCKLRFCQTEGYETPGFSSSFFATRLGGYIVRELLADFTFLEAVLMDTFISHDSLWESLRDLTIAIGSERDTVKRIALRIERVKLFWKNMADQYFLLLSEALRRGLPAEWCTNPFNDLESVFASNCDRVEESAKRNYGRKGDGGN